MKRSHRKSMAIASMLGAVGATQVASAALLGGGVVSLDAWNQSASAEIGRKVSVFRMYLAFDGAGDWFGSRAEQDNIVLNIYDANIRSHSMLYQAPGGSDVAPVVDFFNPKPRWDSWVTIGAAVNETGTQATDPNFHWEKNGLSNDLTRISARDCTWC